MKKISLLIILAFGLTVVFVTSANAEVLNVEVDTAGGLKKLMIQSIKQLQLVF